MSAESPTATQAPHPDTILNADQHLPHPDVDHVATEQYKWDNYYSAKEAELEPMRDEADQLDLQHAETLNKHLESYHAGSMVVRLVTRSGAKVEKTRDKAAQANRSYDTAFQEAGLYDRQGNRERAQAYYKANQSEMYENAVEWRRQQHPKN